MSDNLNPVRSTIPRRRVALSVFGPSRTKQAEAQSCDINFILKQYKRTGYIEHINQFQATYGEAPAYDYREALELVRNADAMFKALPATVRARFGHDPGQLLDFCSDPANLEEARTLGLAHPVTQPSAPPAPKT